MHIPVLLNESIDLLQIEAGDVFLDATEGLGGHTEEVWKRFGDSVVMAGIDADPEAIDIARARLETAGMSEVKLAVLNFRDIDKAVEVLDIKQPTKILFDLGWNKSQFEEGKRGFSFQHDEPLNMAFGKSEFNAADIVNSWEEENITTIISSYGEERFAKNIAKKIVERRQEKPIKTSLELAEIVKNAVPAWYRFRKIHPATKTFQALRIAVNDELRSLESGLAKAFEMIPPRGRIAVISFHSLEDRIVKHFFKDQAVSEKAKLITKRPVTATEEEIQANPRSRSATLRAIEKI
jgi:16S rRNA (cytosine1402-N4)-methyltransferase